MASKGAKGLFGGGFLSSVFKDFVNGVIDDEDEKFRKKQKKNAEKYAKKYSKNMDKEVAPGMTLRDAIKKFEKENKGKSSKYNPEDYNDISNK